mmetsp:Transcript_9782/g.19787  ORF Transcript_9782/g.19787 Transcript_9782/m.19787 type:complete len:217 (-) Transcript_9782:258-908(-)
MAAWIAAANVPSSRLLMSDLHFSSGVAVPAAMQSLTTRGTPDGKVSRPPAPFKLSLSTVALTMAGTGAGTLAARAGLDMGIVGGLDASGAGGRLPIDASLAKSLRRIDDADFSRGGCSSDTECEVVVGGSGCALAGAAAASPAAAPVAAPAAGCRVVGGAGGSGFGTGGSVVGASTGATASVSGWASCCAAGASALLASTPHLLEGVFLRLDRRSR